MKFNLISNLDNGVGLQQDCLLLQAELLQLGHEASLVHYLNWENPLPDVDINIHLELINTKLYPLAKSQWFVPNPEWFFQRDLISTFDKVLAKTQDTVRIFSEMVNGKTSYLGWKARDLYKPEIKIGRAHV